MNSNLARSLVLAGWLVVGYLAFVAESGGAVRSAATGLFWLLVALHAIEVLVLASRLRWAGAPFRPSDLLLTMLFGVFHLGPRLADLRKESA